MKTAFVTGGSSGIGAATVRRLAGRGLTVAVGYHSNRAAAEALVAALPGAGHFALRAAVDEARSLTEAATALRERFGTLDVLVNSGGATQAVPAADLDALDDALFARIVQVNLAGPFAVIRALRPLLNPAGGVIVNVSSLSARTGVGSNLAYCAAKGGLDTLTVALARVLAPGVRVLGVAPAGVDTGFVPGRDPEALQRMARTVPLRHVTTAEDVAAAIAACVFDLTSSTGITIPVDEGRGL